MPESLLSVNSALQRLIDRFQPMPEEQIPLSTAGCRVLSRPVISPLDLPPFHNSSMDGFALVAADTAGAAISQPVTLQVIADIPAGQVVAVQVNSGQAVRIMTGAALPNGADAVAPVEITDFQARDAGVPAPSSVQVRQPVQPGENVRPQGQDVRQGDQVLPAQIALRPQDLGLLSMLGMACVSVRRKPQVAVFSTGDELLPVSKPLRPGTIHDSNSYTLIALVEGAGGVAVPLGIIPDQREAVQSALDQAAAAGVDLILSSAGVSVGAFDFVRSVVETHGTLDFWRVNMRPGKPLAYGDYRGIPFIGLPGNPVSAFVTFEVFVRPVMERLAGLPGGRRRQVRAVLEEPVASDGRESYLRAVLRSEGGVLRARLTGHQGSGNLLSLVQANAFVIIPSGVETLSAGASVDAWLLGEMIQG